MLSFFVAYIFVRWMVFRQRSQLQPLQVGDFVLVCLAGALIGARLGHCLFYDPNLFMMFKAEFPYWGIFAVDEGGMSSFGGLLGLVIASSAFAISAGISRIYLYDLIAVTAPLCVFFGRIANFINGELIGREAPAGFPLAIKFPSEILSWPQYFPEKLAQLSPVISKINGMTPDNWAAMTNIEVLKNDEQAKQQVMNSLLNVINFVQNKNAEVTEALSNYLTSRHPVQIYGALSEGIFLFLFLFILWFRPRKAGVVSATGLILYSIIYFVLEFYREPDPALGLGFLDLSRGQFLSIFSFLSGFVLIVLWGRRETLSVSGWGRGQSVKLHRR